MFELVRTTEGEISKAQFVRGAKQLLLLNIFSLAFFFLIKYINTQMVWMTTAIAPIFGALVAFVVFSFLYFWCCLFLKRFRAQGLPLWPVYVWLALFFISPILQLVAYQFNTNAVEGFDLVWLIEYISIFNLALFVACWLYLVFMGFKNNKASV
ncbi:MAG: hypothetical protein AB8B49_09060 [Nitratireductor sp.]